jgi:hypothetical protein
MDLKCPFHSGITENIDELCRRCDELKTSSEKQWDAIGSKASASSVRWGVGIGIIVLISVLGVMWAMTDRLGTKLDSLTTITIEVRTKIDQHLKSPNEHGN